MSPRGAGPAASRRAPCGCSPDVARPSSSGHSGRGQSWAHCTGEPGIEPTVAVAYLGSGMYGVHEVHPDSLETLVTEGIELPYVEYGDMEPAVKLVFDGEDYWYHRTLPLKGYSAVMARYIRELQAEG